MKLSRALAISSLYGLALASSRRTSGHVYIYDPVADKAETQFHGVSPETTRLILAQRLGVSQFHSIEHPSEIDLGDLNSYGGKHRKVFGARNNEGSQQANAHVLVWLEDVEDPSDVLQEPSLYTNGFLASHPPSPSDNLHLLRDLALQADSLPRRGDPEQLTLRAAVDAELLLKPLKTADVHNGYLTIFHADKNDHIDPSQLKETLHKIVSSAKEAGEKGWSVTVVMLPPASSNSKRSAHPWGTYNLPSVAEARREKTEALLSPSASQPSKAPVSNVLDNKENDDQSPVLGILPSCFESQNACEKQTNNCSSHGSCNLVRKGDGKGKTDCYSCLCKKQVAVVPGKGMEESFKTTYWGGPACQKKDISMPFFLFVSVGIILAFLISAGIGLLYSMGSEELPSVIGAGVSGPAKK